MADSNNKVKTTLNKKSIAAIADQVEARIRQTPVEAPVPVKAQGIADSHIGVKKIFFLGAASGLAAAVVMPFFGKSARPVVRGAIKGGIAAGRYVQKVASTVKEDIQDITAEAKADLDVEEHPGHGPAHS